MKTGGAIKKVRTQAGLTQAELAERLGVTPQVISQYERGVKNPKIETIKKIAAALGVPWYELYSGEETEDSQKEIRMLFRSVAEETENTDEEERLDSASSYLLTLKYNAQRESGTVWTSDEENEWSRKKLPEIAEMFHVREEDLDDTYYWSYPENEKYLREVHVAVIDQPIRFRSLEKICRVLSEMTAEGQALAAERVEELAQIPKYQRPDGPQQDPPAGAGDKERVQTPTYQRTQSIPQNAPTDADDKEPRRKIKPPTGALEPV